ncbi:MAG: NAD(P)H-hydrate dehydratase, partial [Clostridia bacterium]
PLADPWAEVLRQVASSGTPVLAVDVPSGVNADTGAVVGPIAVQAAVTVTFQALKPAHVLDPGASLAGAVRVADIGLAAATGSELELVDPSQVHWQALERTPGAHKYAMGRVLVVGGSDPYAGAPALAGLGALRSGAGYVELYVPASILTALRTLHALPLVMRGGEESDRGGLTVTNLLRERLEAARSVILGPGLEASPELVEVLRVSRKPVVVDAGAFQGWIASGRPRWPEAVFTPHAAEAALLIGEPAAWVQQHRVEAVRRMADMTGGTVVLKGRHTLAAEGGRPVSVNLAGGSELATMGTGDVLAGVIASLLARGWSTLDAARGAVLWHGFAGELARTRRGGFSVTAVDVAEELGPAAAALQSGARPAEWPVLCS